MTWTTTPPSRYELEQQGFHILEFGWLKVHIQASQTAGTIRSSLENPAEPVLSLFQRHARIAVLDVDSRQHEHLRLIYGYVVEPAFRCGCTLLIGADQGLRDLRCPSADPGWRYPWALERLLYLLDCGRKPQPVAVPETVNRWQRLWRRISSMVGRSDDARAHTRLDPEQVAAVNAGDGVIQVIAPAGSGKTTVLIERVKTLQSRGTPASRILCMSFNRDAKVEIGQRLSRAGVEGVVVRSFHGMGLAILKEEGYLRNGIGSVDDDRLQQLIEQAVALETTASGSIPHYTGHNTPRIPDARNAVSTYKLALMLSPEEALRQAQGATLDERIVVRVFDLHERELARQQLLDFDDLVARSVTLLQTDAQVRHRWQDRFKRVLVDEYQDIEPSQALLVGILAAPQDSLFCVGDEDQCIYAWRRATVQRIIELDQVYPGLERHALIRNYRCGRRITEASRRLIQHNRQRFRKPLHAGAGQKGKIVVAACTTLADGADLVAYLVSDADTEEMAILARTSHLLEEVKAARSRWPGPVPNVELATIHAAKGREWDRVILFGVDEGQTPHAQAMAEGGIEDERRLFYVALTRAKQRLEIVCTKGRESRFLREAGLRVSLTR